MHYNFIGSEKNVSQPVILKLSFFLIMRVTTLTVENHGVEPQKMNDLLF